MGNCSTAADYPDSENSPVKHPDESLKIETKLQTDSLQSVRTSTERKTQIPTMANYEYRSVDNLKESHLNTIDAYECLLAEWNAVTLNYKKDGGHYANLRQNFNGARVYQNRYSTDPSHKELSVTCMTKRTGYHSDSISLWKSSGDWRENDIPLTVDEILVKMEQRKAALSEYISEYQMKLDELNKLQECMDSVQKLIDDLPENMRSDAAYMLREYYFRY